MKVLISGARPAGLTAAYRLKRYALPLSSLPDQRFTYSALRFPPFSLAFDVTNPGSKISGSVAENRGD